MSQVYTLLALQTPEGSLLDIMRNAYDLLSSCNVKVPKVDLLLFFFFLILFFYMWHESTFHVMLAYFSNTEPMVLWLVNAGCSST